MTLKLNGTNSVAAPAYAGDDADTGLQCGTNELKLVTGGSARATVDSSGNFGIGTSTPAVNLHVTSTNARLRLDNSATGIAALELIGGNQTNPFYIYTDTHRNLIFQDHSTERMRIQSDGTLRLASSCPGIDFSQIQTNASGMSSETLDSYEEGTWTPSLGCTGQSGSFTLPVRQGFYTKIGRVVHLQFRITWSAKPGTGGHLYLEGFPFAYPATTGQGEFGAGVAFKSGLNSNSYVSMLGSATGGGSRTAVKFWDDAGAAINVTTGNNISSSGDVRGSLTYMV